MTFRPRSLASLIAWAALLAPDSAGAEADSAQISAAKQAFESALTAEAEQRWAAAAHDLREAIAVKDTPGLRFHLAHCESELGHLVEALREYDRALELLRGGAKAPDVQKLLAPARAALLQRLPRLSLELPADVQTLQIAIDNHHYPPSELVLGVPLNPGLHELRVQAPGRVVFAHALSLREGDRVVLPVALPAVAVAPSGGPNPAARAALEPQRTPVAPAPEASSSSAKLYLMIGESVLTAAGLGVGIGYAVARGSASDRIASAQARIDAAAPGNAAACNPPEPQLLGACSDLNAALEAHDRAVILSQVGFVTAGVGAAALLTTWLVYPSPTAQASGFSWRPVAGFGRLGVIGRF